MGCSLRPGTGPVASLRVGSGPHLSIPLLVITALPLSIGGGPGAGKMSAIRRLGFPSPLAPLLLKHQYEYIFIEARALYIYIYI